MTRLSVCTIALDEEQLIGAMLESVAPVADEVVVAIDSRTTDATRIIAEQHGAKVRLFDWREDFSYARNLSLFAATGDWALVLDADERLLPVGVQVVRDVLERPPASETLTGVAFTIAQQNLAGRLLAVQPSSGRLFRRCPQIRYRGVVHEEPFWLPDPQRTRWLLVTGEPQIAHVGCDPTLWAVRGKQERNVRLLERRIAEHPGDQYARAKLAQTQAVAQP